MSHQIPVTHHDDRDDLIARLDRGEVLETPLTQLRAARFTPQTVMFVRNSNPYPPGKDTLAPVPLTGTLEVTGLVRDAFELPLEDLQHYPYQQIECVIQCAGNGRAYYTNAGDIDGCQWEKGAVANGLWGGVRVQEVLERATPMPGAHYLTATGIDGRAPYEKSIPLSDVLEHGLLAYTLNGEPLGGVHGGPVRLVMPGFFATVNVKWLQRLTLTAHETTHEAQQKRYRVPDSHGGTRPCWKQPVKSIIWSPLAGQSVHSGPLEVAGCAWNDGAALLERVDVSIDGGLTWLEADLDQSASPFAWRRWRIELQLSQGEYTILARATDTAGRTQPMIADVKCNLDGYEYNGVDQVRVTVIDP